MIVHGATTGTTVEVPLTIESGSEPVASTTTATASPNTVKVKKGVSRINVTVTATGATPTGDVAVFNGATELGRATLTSAGTARIIVGPFNRAGAVNLRVRYLGDANVEPSQTTTRITVTKRTPKIAVTRTPAKVVAGKTKATLRITVDAEELTPTGRVEVRSGGKVLRAGNLVRGRVALTLPKFGSAGQKALRIVYLGKADVTQGTRDITIRVVRR